MSLLDWHVAVTDIPREGLTAERAASPAECAALASHLSIAAIEALAFRYRVVARAGGRYEVTGRIAASVTQECVVSLEPVAAQLSLPVQVEFVPSPPEQARSRGAAADEEEDDEGEDVDFAAPDVEIIENGRLDLGRIVMEEVASGLDPYPRKPEAAFSWSDERAAAAISPFAKLSALKKESGES